MNGCSATEKCGWDLSGGRSVCVPNGTTAVGGACVFANGRDDCAAGSTCVQNKCVSVCSLQTADSCGATAACVELADFFVVPPDPANFGVCLNRCDPLAQTGCGVGQGCYVNVTATTSMPLCAPAGTVAIGQMLSPGSGFNACVPGAAARRNANGTFECGALCRPAAVTSTMNQSDEGGVAPATCQAKGAADPSMPDGESCRFWWAREPFDTPSSLSNTLGFCIKHAQTLYDSNGDSVPDAPLPRCVNLTTADVVPPVSQPPVSDALSFWCVPTP